METSKDLNANSGIYKFPRTKHLSNILKSATRDDLIMTKEEINNFLGVELTIIEKCDGANLNFTVDKDYNIRIQNRSHFVTSKDGEQFKILDKWVNDHKEALYSILDPPETKVLYGELVYIKHSIEYTELPDYFLAFDLYNIKEKTFMAYDKLVELLSNTNIQIVPLISKIKIKKVEDLLPLVKSKSKYYDGEVEGIYIKICDDNIVKNRAKLVRSDFLCGGEEGDNIIHWKKKQFVRNKLKEIEYDN